jgi:hypothetical protein
MVKIFVSTTEQRNLKIDPGIHALLKAFAYRNNMGISTAANLLIPRAIAYEWKQPIPPLKEQLANIINERMGSQIKS